jgi:methionyl-tRNA formyltransferase
MNIIFMGTPDFDVPFLIAISSTHHTITAVFTQNSKPQGRGMEVKHSKIYEAASSLNVPIYTPKTLRSEESLTLLESIEADVIVVVAYGFIIPKSILKMKKYGCLNVHPSALPRFRGAAPLQRTIMSGDKETEVCIIQMDEGLDTGDIILSEKIPLSDRVTLIELQNITAHIGSKLLIIALDNIAKLPRIPQAKNGVVYAHKLTKEEGLINWKDDAFSIDCKIRGMSPWPGVFFRHNGILFKIIEANYISFNNNAKPGTIIGAPLVIACGKGALQITKIQKPGKRPLPIEEFMKGYRIGKEDMIHD